MIKLLINPFSRFAGREALIAAILVAVIAATLAALYNTRFDGVLDIHFTSSEVLFRTALLDQLANILSLTAVFWVLSFIFGARQTRLIDIAGTLALARAPYVLAPFVNSTGLMSRLTETFENTPPAEMATVGLGQLIPILPLLIIIVVLTIWMIALSFNAFKVSTNLAGPKLIISFIAGIILAEIISKTLIFSLS